MLKRPHSVDVSTFAAEKKHQDEAEDGLDSCDETSPRTN